MTLLLTQEPRFAMYNILRIFIFTLISTVVFGQAMPYNDPLQFTVPQIFESTVNMNDSTVVTGDLQYAQNSDRTGLIFYGGVNTDLFPYPVVFLGKGGFGGIGHLIISDVSDFGGDSIDISLGLSTFSGDATDPYVILDWDFERRFTVLKIQAT